MADIKRAKESFTYWDEKGTPRDIPAGTLIDPDRMSGYKGREHLFEDVDLYVDRVEEARRENAKPTPTTKVETATAEPGERRTVSTPKREFRPPARNQEESK